MVINLSKNFLQTQSFSIVWNQKKYFSSSEKQDKGKGSPLTSKGLAKHLPRIQNLYQITYIFCNTVQSISIQPFDTNWLAPRETFRLQYICRAQLVIQTTNLPCYLPCNYVTSLLAYCRQKIRINRCIYPIKTLLRYFKFFNEEIFKLRVTFLEYW